MISCVLMSMHVIFVYRHVAIIPLHVKRSHVFIWAVPTIKINEAHLTKTPQNFTISPAPSQKFVSKRLRHKTLQNKYYCTVEEYVLKSKREYEN